MYESVLRPLFTESKLTFIFTAAFLLLCLLAAYLGLSSIQIPQVNDKALHALTFFALTVGIPAPVRAHLIYPANLWQITFYWILDTTRRRTLNLTLLVVTFGLGLGSEFVQSVLPNGRVFDPVDIGANLLGSLAGLGLCNLYHKRMLDRRRKKKGYGAVPQDGEGEDIELGEGAGREAESRVGSEGDEAWDDMGGVGSAESEGGLTQNSADAGKDIADARN